MPDGVRAADTYLVLGREGSDPISLADVASGEGGMLIEASGADDLDVPSFQPLGDLNGDGLADFALGAYSYDQFAGRVFVVFGRTGTEPIRLSEIAAGQGGYTIDPPAGYLGGFARAVVNAGDVNGDGLTDLLVAAPAFVEEAPGGRAYVVFGKTSGTPVRAGDEGVGFTMLGEGEQGENCCGAAGDALGAAGDVNGDGLADLFVSAPQFGGVANLQSGRTYVVFGKSDGATIDLADVTDGQGGYARTGSRLEQIGFDVAASVIDHDLDGVPDVVTRNGNADTQIHLGDPSGDGPTIETFSPATPGSWGLSPESSVGDLDGDGVPDLVFAGYDADDEAGSLLVIHR